MIEFLVGAACYLSLFAGLPGIGPAMQVLAIVLLFGAAAWAVILGRVKAIPLSAPEIVMYVVGVAYVAVAMLVDEDSVAISAVFLCTILFISIVSRAISLERLMDVGAAVAMLCVLTAIAVDRKGAVAALMPRAGGAVDRFMPMGLAPNLIGYIFGAGSILMMRRAMVSNSSIERLAMGGGALLSCLFVLAASSRSSLIALFAAALVAIFVEYGVKRFFSLKWMKLGTITFIILGLAFSGRIAAYFTRMLELDSETRGLASGGSGRTALWARGVDMLFNDPMRFMFGGGFRSSSANVIGFSTESSYITILLDSGMFIGAAVILVFAYSPIKALKLTSPQSRHASALVLVVSFLTFLIVESVFNRYLLAIGNPASLLSLLLLFTVWMRQEPVVTVDQFSGERKAVEDLSSPLHR
jgi:exopolysaccharide production protein ExoQ